MSIIPLNDDKTLLQQLRDGDEIAFATLYKIYAPVIYANIFRMVKAEDTADDLLQEVFLKIWEKRETIEPEKSFKGYLFTCSKFLVLNFLRHISIEKQVANYFACNQAQSYLHVEEKLYLAETENLLQIAIIKLPPQRQRVYTLCKIEGLTYEEVAERLGISITTVQDHIVKANRFIRDQLTKGNAAALAGLFCLYIL